MKHLKKECMFTRLKETAELATWLDGCISAGLDGIILSDYKKGVLTEKVASQIIETAKAAHIPVLVDPKGKDWTKYEGADFVTPNMKELSECIGRDVANEGAAVVAAATELLSQYDFKNLMVTRSEKGITVINKDGKVWNNPATAQEVFDVSGAGDTVAAAFLSAIAGHLSIRTGLQIANAAAGIVVRKVGTYPIHRSEMIKLWSEWQPPRWAPYRPLDWDQTAAKIRQWQEKGETVVFTNGCFDILHRGHVLYLQQAAMLGDHLIVGLNSDASVKRLKGETRPLVRQEDRAVIMSALGCVDEVVIFDEDTPHELLSVLKPDILVKGGDYKADEVVGREFVKRVEIISFEGNPDDCRGLGPVFGQSPGADARPGRRMGAFCENIYQTHCKDLPGRTCMGQLKACTHGTAYRMGLWYFLRHSHWVE